MGKEYLSFKETEMFFYVLGIITAAYLGIGVIFLSLCGLAVLLRFDIIPQGSNTYRRILEILSPGPATALGRLLVLKRLFTILAVWPVITIAIYKEGSLS